MFKFVMDILSLIQFILLSPLGSLCVSERVVELKTSEQDSVTVCFMGTTWMKTCFQNRILLTWFQYNSKLVSYNLWKCDISFILCFMSCVWLNGSSVELNFDFSQGKELKAHIYFNYFHQKHPSEAQALSLLHLLLHRRIKKCIPKYRILQISANIYK